VREYSELSSFFICRDWSARGVYILITVGAVRYPTMERLFYVLVIT